jgi:hypothetical protein
VPLRVWISNHHKQRIPSINIYQSEAAKINGYIANLTSQSKAGATVISGADGFFADAAVAEPATSIRENISMSDGVVPGEADEEEATVDYSECLNCQ